MKKAILMTLAVAALMVPAALAAAPAQGPTDYCKANPGLIGAGKVYASFGACVTAQAGEQKTNTVNAARTCKAEQLSMGNDAFAAKYGTNKSKSNVVGKCVSKIAAAKTAEQQAAEMSAAKKCRTAENAAKTGAGKTWHNFGACVKALGKTS
jgi:hypothetical protein